MRKTILVLVGLMLVASVAFAHPPSDIIITYDPATKVVKAVIMHDVSNPAQHYIKKVDVGLNDKEIISHFISRQDTPAEQTVSYLIPDAKTGDVISVEAYCSISGKLEKEIKVQ